MPAGLGREPLRLPQEMQSSSSQQTAPPAGESAPGEARLVSGVKPNWLAAAGVARTIVLWLALLGTSAGKVEVPVTAPEAS